MNALNTRFFHEMDDLVAKMNADANIRAMIITGEGKAFVAGADIAEMVDKDSDGGESFSRLGQNTFSSFGKMRIPVIAAINGFALGGGLELAMACDYRLAIENPKPILGLPEVQLGIHPGFGGTVRAVRISGVRLAMELMLTGKSITASKGKRVGLIDRICGSDNWKSAAVSLVSQKPEELYSG